MLLRKFKLQWTDIFVTVNSKPVKGSTPINRIAGAIKVSLKLKGGSRSFDTNAPTYAEKDYPTDADEIDCGDPT